MAELVDARDSKSREDNTSCGFESHLGHIRNPNIEPNPSQFTDPDRMLVLRMNNHNSEKLVSELENFIKRLIMSLSTVLLAKAF